MYTMIYKCPNCSYTADDKSHDTIYGNEHLKVHVEEDGGRILPFFNYHKSDVFNDFINSGITSFSNNGNNFQIYDTSTPQYQYPQSRYSTWRSICFDTLTTLGS